MLLRQLRQHAVRRIVPLRVPSLRKGKVCAGSSMTPPALKSARRALGLSARGMAVAVGVNPRTVRRWEAGDSRIPAAVSILVSRMLAALAPQAAPSTPAPAAPRTPAASD